MNQYGNILSRLRKVRPCKRDQTWSACCPAHNDGRPSLLVFVGRTGCLCARCYKGCSFRAIVEATGTRPEDWFPPKENARRRMDERKIAATYDYKNERGDLLYQVVRYAPKDFRQRRVDPHGAWIWNIEGVDRVLYNLPDLAARVDQPVIVVEGEKDVESLRKLGLLATTNVGGAGKWEFGYGQFLRSRRVAILPDNDPVGWRHAAMVAGNLLYWGAESIRIVHLPGTGDGGDVTDWLTEAGPTATDKGKREALVKLIRAAPEWCVRMPETGRKAA